MGRELVVPLQGARARIDGDQRVGVEIVALAVVTVIIRIRIAGAPVQEIELGIVGAGHPRAAAAAFQHTGVGGPRLAAPLPKTGNGVEPPDALARCRIVGVEKAPGGIFTAGDPDDHLAVDHERCQGRRVPGLVVSQDDVPKNPSGRAVERQQMRVERDHEQAMVKHAEASVHRRLRTVGEIGWQVATVLPERTPRARVERPREVVRAADVQHAVPQQRGRLESPAARRRAGLKCPLGLQARNIVARDRGQRAVTLSGVIARIREPARRILQPAKQITIRHTRQRLLVGRLP